MAHKRSDLIPIRIRKENKARVIVFNANWDQPCCKRLHSSSVAALWFMV